MSSTNLTTPSDDSNRVNIAGLYDLQRFPWARELLEFTFRSLNDHQDGWFDDVLRDVQLEYSISDSACDERVAASAFLDLVRSDFPPHGIVGGRCSAPTKDIAFLASVDNRPVISPAATAPELSVQQDYPLFSRLVAPDDPTGEVGALVSVLRRFGWSRIAIIATDTPYTNSFKIQLRSAWEGEHTLGDDHFVGEFLDAGSVQLTDNGDEVDLNSVEHVLGNVPVNNPNINSKVIVLIGHHHHTYEILKKAQELNFQKDTIWVGGGAWTGRWLPDEDMSWMPPVPGYIGIAPKRDSTSLQYKDFMERLQKDQRSKGRPVMEELPDSSAHAIVDSTLALSMALSKVAPDQRRNGTAVVQEMRQLKFQGVGGWIEFNDKGDWAHPRYDVLTLPQSGGHDNWVSIGTAGPDFANIDASKVCYADVGCVDYIPSEKYPVPSPVWKTALAAGFGTVVVTLLFVAFLYIREFRRKRPLREQVKLLQEELQGIDAEGDAVQEKKGKLYHQLATLLDQPTPDHWTDENGLVAVAPKSEEYKAVLHKMRSTMNNDETCHITALYRVQNVGIWSYYVFRKNQMANKYGVDISDSETLSEVSVWHGSSTLNPDVIYNDMQEGFMVNYAQKGMYGRGIYFAERAGYADCYAYRVEGVGAPDESGSFQEQSEREMFLVKLLVGCSANMDHNENEIVEEECRSLVAPPPTYDDYGKYDTVTGVGDAEYKTKIHVVYENGRAFPEYLVRYKKEKIDPSRKRRSDLDTSTTSTTSTISTSVLADSVSIGTGTPPSAAQSVIAPVDLEAGIPPAPAIWMYEGDGGGWEPFSNHHQSQIEDAYQTDPAAQLRIEIEPWTYLVDLGQGTQTNVDHPANRKRKIQRMTLE